MRIAALVSWGSLVIYACIVAGTFIANRNVRGEQSVGLMIPFLMIPAILLFSAVLGFAQYQGWTGAVNVLAVLLAVPLLFIGPMIGISIMSDYMEGRTEQLRGTFRSPEMTEIGAAIRKSDHDKLKELLAAHPAIDWSARDETGLTLLGVALEEAFMEAFGRPDRPLCLRLVVEAGAKFPKDPAPRESEIFRHMITDINEGPYRIETLQLVLRAGADPNTPDVRGQPALIGEYMEVNKARALLDAGAELRSLRRTDEPYMGWDAMMFAAMRASWDLALLYLERGCDPNYQAPDGKSAFRIASERAANPNQENERARRDGFLKALAAARAAATNSERRN